MPKAGQLAALSNVNNMDNTEIFYSRMPVMKVHSNDKMPMATPGNVDRMPVKRIKVVDPLEKLQQPAP